MADLRLPPRHRPNVRLYLDNGDITFMMTQDELLASMKLQQLRMMRDSIDRHIAMREEVPNDDE